MHDNECFMVQCADSEEIRSPHSLQAMCSLILVLQHLGGDHCRDARSCKILQLWIARVCGKVNGSQLCGFFIVFSCCNMGLRAPQQLDMYPGLPETSRDCTVQEAIDGYCFFLLRHTFSPQSMSCDL